MTTGVISVVGYGREPVAIPEEEIEAVKAVLRSGLPADPCEYLREGQRVRVTDGSLDGVEGVLVKKKNQCRMVVSVTYKPNAPSLSKLMPIGSPRSDGDLIKIPIAPCPAH